MAVDIAQDKAVRSEPPCCGKARVATRRADSLAEAERERNGDARGAGSSERVLRERAHTFTVPRLTPAVISPSGRCQNYLRRRRRSLRASHMLSCFNPPHTRNGPSDRVTCALVKLLAHLMLSTDDVHLTELIDPDLVLSRAGKRSDPSFSIDRAPQ